MKLKFALAAIVGLVLFTNGSYIAFAQPIDGGRKDDEIKSKVQERLSNKKTEVKVEKLDGTKLKGRITQADDTSFTIVESKSNQSSVIAYSDTRKIKGSGWPTSAKIALGVGAAAVITFVAFGIAFKNATRDN
jgi:hypothetical protein